MGTTAVITGKDRCIQRLIDAGYNDNNAYDIVSQIAYIAYSSGIDIHSEQIQYINSTIDRLFNQDITQEQIQEEYNKYKQEYIQQEKEKEERKNKARQAKEQKYIEQQKETVYNALYTIGTLHHKLHDSDLENWINSIIEEHKSNYRFKEDIILIAQDIKKEYELKALETAIKQNRQRTNEQHAEYEAQQAEYHKAEKERKALAAKGQFIFDGLLIQYQKKSTSFLLPNENYQKITAYKVIKRLSKDAFRAYKKQISFKNNKIQILPYSERLRLIFYFRQQYRNTPILANSKDIADFIYTALQYTDNRKLNNNWYACLDVFSKDDIQRYDKAASLLAYYGWADDYRKEYPVSGNIFYTVETASGTRKYNIVKDNIILRFMAIERKGREYEAYSIVADNKAEYKDRINNLQSIFQPLLWKRDGISMGLKAEEREQCNARINEYIEELLSHNAFDNITLQEHISRTALDKSDTGIVFAEPQQIIFSLDDMDFADYKYNITAENGRENAIKSAVSRSQNAANKNFEKVIGNIGDIVTTQQLYSMGIDKDKIPRQIRNNKIERIKKGYYRIISG